MLQDPCPKIVRLTHEHFSDPIIIDNPPAKLDLLPETEADQLEEVPQTAGREWNLLDKNEIRSIHICVDGRLWKMIFPLQADAIVTIDFDDTNPHSPQKGTGSMTIQWRTNRTISIRCVTPHNNGFSFRREPKLPNGRHGLACPGNRSYEIAGVSFTDKQGNPEAFVRPQGAQEVTVAIQVAQ